jgi:hypothetical protein
MFLARMQQQRFSSKQASGLSHMFTTSTSRPCIALRQAVSIRGPLGDRPTLSGMLHLSIRRNGSTSVLILGAGTGGGFSRKDKLKQHERTYHGQFACQFSHCIYGFLSDEKLREHQWIHGKRECGLGSCGRTSTSCFTWWTLINHLIDDHKISHEAATQATAKLNYRKGTLTSAHFPYELSDFQDCEGCIKKLKEAKPGKDGKEER